MQIALPSMFFILFIYLFLFLNPHPRICSLILEGPGKRETWIASLLHSLPHTRPPDQTHKPFVCGTVLSHPARALPFMFKLPQPFKDVPRSPGHEAQPRSALMQRCVGDTAPLTTQEQQQQQQNPCVCSFF